MTSLSVKHLFGIALVAIVLLVCLELRGSSPADASPSFFSNILTTATTSTSFSVTTSTRILSTTTNPLGTPGVTSNVRVFASICTNSSNPVALNFDQDKAANIVAGRVTVLIAAAAGYSSCYEITDRNLYQGSVQASSTNQTTTPVFVSEYVQ